MPAEQLVTTLIIDAAGAVEGASQFTAAADTVAAASTTAAAGADKLGAAVETTTTTVALSARALASQKAALRAQSQAAEGSLGAVINLTRQTSQLELAQKAVANAVQTGAVSMAAGEAEMQKLAARHADHTAATEKLRAGQASVADILKQYPNLASSLGASFAGAKRELDTHAEGVEYLGVRYRSLESGLHGFIEQIALGMISQSS
jgi:hypothetical protein